MHTLVTVVSVAIVVGLAVFGLSSLLGQWAILLWVGLGVAALMGLARRVNA